jgi:hypothetical protein
MENEDQLHYGTDEKLPEDLDRRHAFDPSHRNCLGCLPPKTDPLSGELAPVEPRVRRVPRYETETLA